MLVQSVENREAEADQRDPGVAGEELAAGVADEGIHRVAHEQAAHVLHVLAHIDIPFDGVHGHHLAGSGSRRSAG